jgi:hypothetical protein
MEQQYQAFPPRSEANKTASMVGAIGGGCAVLIGLILLVAFFLPWGDGESAFDAVTQDLEADHLLGELLYKLIFASTGLAGLGSVIFGLLLATGSQRGAAFRAWMSTSIGSMVVVGGFLPGLLLSYALLGNTTDELEIGIWLSLGGVVLLAVATLIGLSSALTRFKDSEIGFMASGYGGRFAVAIGLLLVVAFFLPWGAEGSAFDIVKEDLGADNFLGELLYKLIFASTALAGMGSGLPAWRGVQGVDDDQRWRNGPDGRFSTDLYMEHRLNRSLYRHVKDRRLAFLGCGRLVGPRLACGSISPAGRDVDRRAQRGARWRTVAPFAHLLTLADERVKISPWPLQNACKRSSRACRPALAAT